MTRSPSRFGRVVVASSFAVLAAAGCSGPGDTPEDGTTRSPVRPTLETPLSPEPTGTSTTLHAEPAPRAVAETVVESLDVPWGLAPLGDGTLLVTLRDAARLVVVDPAARTTTDVTGPGADLLAAETVPGGEAGLLGVAIAPPDADRPGEVFVYRTGADDNAVLRGSLDGTTLGELTTVIDGIPRAGNHDGGGLAFGPDGYLYVGTGDAADPANSQDPGSLGGKILRLEPDGDPAPGNPDAGSPVWTLGHRNVQGLGWDPGGRMFASEFGQNAYDELNVIERGGNYGWPDVEGPGGGDGDFVDPVAWWAPAEASPSGLAVTRDAVYLAGLRGETLWRVPFLETADAGTDVQTDGDSPGLGRPQALLAGELGRLRAVVAVGAGDGDGLWVLTSNTDGRGSPAGGDDRLVRVALR
ncbi:PQQ-dependent sugar dehydrogenase [Isoptericola hypogeus]|uniref:PQQ-dependent sugar dehydrogenase n=1 Tax=Isoptericola hypogeus TaxID=300179 RepID=A0ABP4VT60_9MICO